MTSALARDRTGVAPWQSSRARAWDHGERAKLVAQAGRAGVVWLAVLVPYVSQQGSLGAADLLTVSILAAVWLAALRAAFASARTIGVGVSAAVGSCTGLGMVVALDAGFPGPNLGAATLLGTAAGVCVSAGVWEWFVEQTSVGRRRVLLVGTSELALAVASEIDRAGNSRFQLIGRVEGDDRRLVDDVFCLGEAEELAAVVDAQRPDLVVLMDERSHAAAVDRLLDATAPGFRVVGLTSFFEFAFGRVPLQHLTPAWFMAVLHLHQPVYTRWSKRTLDIAVASVGLLLAAPLLPVIALLVRCTPGPVIYRQARLGEGGREFTIYKFRTMVRNAEEAGKPRWAATDDDRCTSIGKILRRTHLDELPQLWNVLVGDMSIVGPRPERREFVTQLESAVPFWNRRLLVKPGLTGWAQVRRGYTADCASAAEKLSYDLWYVRHGRLSVDVAVCLQTARLLLESLLPRRRSRSRAPCLDELGARAPDAVPVKTAAVPELSRARDTET